MLNHNLHRVTDLSDAERWADERQPARYLHTQAMVYARPYIPAGCDQQGRIEDGARATPYEELKANQLAAAGMAQNAYPQCFNDVQGAENSVQPDPGAQAASEYGNDAEDWRKASWWEDARFLLAAAAGTAGLGLVLFLFRGA